MSVVFLGSGNTTVTKIGKISCSHGAYLLVEKDRTTNK